MEINKQNIGLATTHLEVFKDSKGFPTSELALAMMSEMVCRMVRNVPCYDFIGPRILRHPDLPIISEEEWYAKRDLPVHATDLDYLFRKLLEMSDGKFPYPAVIRRCYWEILGAPADGKEVFVLAEE